MTLDDYLSQPGVQAVDIAAEAGISEASLSRIRRGEQNISRDTIRALVAATGGAVTAEELVFGGIHAGEPATASAALANGQSPEMSGVRGEAA